LQLDAKLDPKNGLIFALEYGDEIVDVVSGWMPAAKPLFRNETATQKPAETSAKLTSPPNPPNSNRSPHSPVSRPPQKHPVKLTIADTRDDYWANGILRQG